MTYFALLVIALALWGFGLWRRGFFNVGTSPLERKLFGLRTALWLSSIAIVAWPLQHYRSQIGGLAYIAIALFVLASFFAVGVFASKAITKRYGASA